MSPHRQLSHSAKRNTNHIKDLFLGLAFQLGPQPKSDDADKDPGRDLEYAAVIHDGTGVIESETFKEKFYSLGKSEEELGEETRRVSRKILKRVREVAKERQSKFCMVAIAKPIPEEMRNKKDVEAPATIWLHLDVIPFVTTPSTSIFTKLPAPSPEASATAAISAGVKHFHPATHTATVVGVDPEDHRVKVDADEEIKLCSLLQYQESTSPELWNRFSALTQHLKDHKTSVAFFSATPQGGGVALMRHAMIRLWNLVGFNVRWHVPEGHPAVFDITKTKIHNVLQGVADDGVEMSDGDKKTFELWTEQNFETFWSKGALDADLIVIDDPQLTALIPYIKKHKPKTKIIFRSHIQIQSNLADDQSTPQSRTWNYLFGFIKDVDLFLAHPVKFFVPKNVHENLPVLYMAPSTDPLDGLNKMFGSDCVQYYRQYFNKLSAEQCGTEVDWDRGYICQIARFDPSKGYPDLLKAYLEFRKKLQDSKDEAKGGGPQLIIMGHGSVDDPDGTKIYEQIHDIIQSGEYELIQGDVAVVRAPPSDGLLGCIMQGAWCATQLSTREGFEVKVTEVINKRVPIIVYDAGGIPLQVKDGLNGWIVPTGDTSKVAELLYKLHTGEIMTKRESDNRAAAESATKGDSSSSPNGKANSDTEDANGGVEPECHLDEVKKGEEVKSAESGHSGTPKRNSNSPDNDQAKHRNDPNTLADDWVKHFDEPMLMVKSDVGSTSEDFWTVGNSTRWMSLISRLLGLSLTPDEKADEEEADDNGRNDLDLGSDERQKEVLEKMEVGKKLEGKGVDGVNVWRMVMGDDLYDSEGSLI